MSGGDARRGNDESRCVPESQAAEISLLPLVLETVPALNCNGLLFACHRGRERKLNEWN